MILFFCSVFSETKPYGPDYTEAWRGMKNCYYKKYTRSLGLCNFSSNKIECILKIAAIKPSANLMECNIFRNCKELRKYLKKHKIVLFSNDLYMDRLALRQLIQEENHLTKYISIN